LRDPSQVREFITMKLQTLFASFLAAFGLQAGELKLGSALPELKGKNHLGEVVKLEAGEGDEWLLLFFYPKALTGG